MAMHHTLTSTPLLNEIRAAAILHSWYPISKSSPSSLPFHTKKPTKTINQKHIKHTNFNKRQKDAAQKPKKAHGKDSEVMNSVEQTKVEKTKATGDQPDRENEQQIKERVPEKRKVYADQCTVFVSNINLKANDEHLHQFFSDVGGVVAIRILHDKFTGKSRGLAYVDFSDDGHLVAAVAKNKQMLLGKKLSIARSDPKHGKKEHARGAEFNNSAESSNALNARQAEQSTYNRGSNNVQLRGKNTFATPRNILALVFRIKN